MARRSVVLRHPPAGFGQVARLLLREEAGEAHVHDRAEADELVDVHGALSIEDVPEALPVHVDPAGELGNADAAVLSSPLYPCDYEIGLVHPFPRSENPFRISENSDCQFFRIFVNLIN